MPSIPRGDQSATVNFPTQKKFVKKPASQQAAIRCTPYLAKKSAHMLRMLLPGGGEIGTAICVEDGSYCAGDDNDSRQEQERGRWKRIREGNEGAGSGEAEAEDRKRGMGEEKLPRERRGSCDDSLVCLNTAMKEVRQRGREPRPGQSVVTGSRWPDLPLGTVTRSPTFLSCSAAVQNLAQGEPGVAVNRGPGRAGPGTWVPPTHFLQIFVISMDVEA